MFQTTLFMLCFDAEIRIFTLFPLHMTEISIKDTNTLGKLKKSGYTPLSVRDELRKNLIAHLQNGKKYFTDILGYEKTVIPEIERAILSRHSINFLGLRGQAKTRMARQLTNLLDEYIPIIAGSEINDDPCAPVSLYARQIVAEKGDETPIEWLHKSRRYTEKLATPDVTVADLIGDTDPIKAANLKLNYSDERVIHFGLIPRSNRGIFVINELPDLQPRLQVALFNILQEGDIQIRGFSLRMPLDIMPVFTANPEDYTNRGTIITPLKDRIQSQILTHYPLNRDISRNITLQEARLTHEQTEKITVPEIMALLVEQLAIEGRSSEYVDQKSGISARMTITAFENLISTAERRLLINGEETTTVRVGDLWGVLPSMIGKMELVYEGEQEGPRTVAYNLLSQAIRHLFAQFFPDPNLFKKQREQENPYQTVVDWFSKHDVELENDLSQKQYRQVLSEIPGLQKLVKKYQPNIPEQEELLFMEFILHGLAEFSLLSKHSMDTGFQFGDLFNSVFSVDDLEDQD